MESGNPTLISRLLEVRKLKINRIAEAETSEIRVILIFLTLTIS